MNRNYKLCNKRHANSDYAMNSGLKLNNSEAVFNERNLFYVKIIEMLQ